MYINFLNHRLLGQTDDVLFMSLKFLGRNDIGEFGTNGRLGHQDTRGKTKAAPIWEAGLENRRQQQNKLEDDVFSASPWAWNTVDQGEMLLT